MFAAGEEVAEPGRSLVRAEAVSDERTATDRRDEAYRECVEITNRWHQDVNMAPPEVEDWRWSLITAELADLLIQARDQGWTAE